MMNSPNGAEEYGSTGLEHLSDLELINYANLVTPLSNRDLDMVSIGLDTKSMYHAIRLLSQIEQIMVEHDLDLERNREQLKAIRRGEWTLDQIEQHFDSKERSLETIYTTSTLPHAPDEARIKELLITCLEMHFGSLANAVQRDPSVERLVRDIQDVLGRYNLTET